MGAETQEQSVMLPITQHIFYMADAVKKVAEGISAVPDNFGRLPVDVLGLPDLVIKVLATRTSTWRQTPSACGGF